MKRNYRAFTLIELLIVVLIIGILAAVAVPQYQKAVTKSRYATMKPLVHSAVEAQKRYYLANGTYATDWGELDIDVEINSNGTFHRILPWGFCNLDHGKQVYCQNTKIQMGYAEDFVGNRICLIYKNKSILHEICKQETNGATARGGGDNQWYYYP